MDAIFGRKNFRNELIWHYGQRTSFLNRHFPRKHDAILFYARSKDALINKVSEPWDREEFMANRHDVVRGEDGAEYIRTDSGKKGFRYLRPVEEVLAQGKPFDTVWPLPILNSSAKERTGHPTQKPVALYDRIVRAGSSEGGIVLDPFCGCATTLVAAENLQRQWVGIDLWERAHELVEKRLQETTGLLGEVTLTAVPPMRTDDGETAAPFLRVKQRVKEPEGERWTRAQMYEHLLDQHGRVCQGCDRTFDDQRYLELDHNVPRSDGGINHITNRVLLCGPCNKLKSNIYTLSGLRRQNRNLGYMVTK